MIDMFRQSIPDITLRSTFIVGYPTETEKDFQELCEFISDTKFDRIGVFKYSPEEDTASFGLKDLDEEIKEERRDILMNLQKEISLEKNRTMTGRKMRVIIDGEEGGYYIGRSEKDAPEVDGEVIIEKGETLKAGCFYDVEVYDSNEYDLFARKI